MPSSRGLLLIIAFFAFIFLVRLLMNVRELQNNLRHIKVELERANPEEQARWKRRRRKLWLRFFLRPF